MQREWNDKKAGGEQGGVSLEKSFLEALQLKGNREPLFSVIM